MVRKCERADFAKVLELIRELAAFEGLKNAVEFTQSEFEKNIFDNKLAEILVCEFGGDIVGYAIFFRSFSTFLGRGGIYLEDLYIKPEFRRKGLGLEIFRFLAKLCESENLGRLEWSCLIENHIGLSFYKKLGAQNLSEIWRNFRLDGENLKNLAK